MESISELMSGHHEIVVSKKKERGLSDEEMTQRTDKTAKSLEKSGITVKSEKSLVGSER